MYREVETVFHEFGHALQHMMTQQAEGLVAGIRGVEWDAVELPSQFMENWCYNRATLNTFGRHYETNEPLPEDLYRKLVAARTFRQSITLPLFVSSYRGKKGKKERKRERQKAGKKEGKEERELCAVFVSFLPSFCLFPFLPSFLLSFSLPCFLSFRSFVLLLLPAAVDVAVACSLDSSYVQPTLNVFWLPACQP